MKYIILLLFLTSCGADYMFNKCNQVTLEIECNPLVTDNQCECEDD